MTGYRISVITPNQDIWVCRRRSSPAEVNRWPKRRSGVGRPGAVSRAPATKTPSRTDRYLRRCIIFLLEKKLYERRNPPRTHVGAVSPTRVATAVEGMCHRALQQIKRWHKLYLQISGRILFFSLHMQAWARSAQNRCGPAEARDAQVIVKEAFYISPTTSSSDRFKYGSTVPGTGKHASTTLATRAGEIKPHTQKSTQPTTWSPTITPGLSGVRVPGSTNEETNEKFFFSFKSEYECRLSFDCPFLTCELIIPPHRQVRQTHGEEILKVFITS